MVKQNKILFIFLFFSLFISCRDSDPKPYKQTVLLKINHTWKDSNLVLNKQYFWDRTFRIDTISIKKISYHINNLKLKTIDSLVVDAQSTYYLIDINQNKTFPQDIIFNTPLEGVKYYISSIEFTIGIEDSLTNLNNKLLSLFSNAMFSDSIKGYINFNLEGSSNGSKILDYKIGGYIAPYKNSRRIKLFFSKPFLLNRNNELSVKADIFKFFKSKNQIDIENVYYVEKPNNDSKMIADNIAKIFNIESIK